jgi:hypothetical protein
MTYSRMPLAAAVLAPLALGAAAMPADDPIAPPDENRPQLNIDRLDQEIVVSDWILCASRTVAERLLRAFDAGMEEAVATLDELGAAKSCGRLPQLRVILRERLDVPNSGDAAGYDALIGVADGWAAGFVVNGQLPAN